MTVENTNPIQHCTANGETTVFAISFAVEGKDNIKVTVNGSVVSVNDYIYDALTKAVVFNAAPEDGAEVVVERITSLERSINYQTYNNSFRPETLNYDLDRIWRVLQEQNIVDAEILARLKDEIDWRIAHDNQILSNINSEADQRRLIDERVRDEIAQEVEARRTLDLNYDTLAQVRDLQVFGALKDYLDTIIASTSPNVFGGVTAGIVFALDKKSVQTHLEDIYQKLVESRQALQAEEQRAINVEQALDEKINNEINRAIATEQLFQTQINTLGVGNKAYLTYAAMIADQANIPATSKVTVTNDVDSSKNGDYQFDGTSFTKSGYDVLTQAKNYVSNTCNAYIVGVAQTNINYTPVDRKLNFANTIWIVTGTERFALSTPQSVNLPLNTPYRLQININTKQIEAVTFTDLVSEGHLILGFITASNTTLKTLDFMYSVDGVNQDSLALAKKYVSDSGYGKAVPLANTNINFNSVDNVLEFKNTIFINTETANYQLVTPQSISITSDGLYRIEINTTTKLLRCVAYSNLREEGFVVLGFVRKTGKVLESNDFGKFTTDGKVESIEVKDSQKADLQSISVTIDILNKQFILSADSWVYPKEGRILAKAVSLSYDNAATLYYVLINKETKLIELFVSSTYLAPLNAGTHYLLFSFSSATAETYGYTGKVTVLGKTVEDNSAETNYSLALTTPNGINFDFQNNKIVISEALWIKYGKGRIQVPIGEIALDPLRNKGYKTILLVDPKTASLTAVSNAAPFNVPRDSIQIGAYLESTLSVWGLNYYSINGVSNIPPKKIRPVFGWSPQNIVEVKVEDSFTPTDTTHLGNITSSKVYAWYDALMAQHPDCITRTFLGNDASGTLPIYMYRFKPLMPRPQENSVINTNVKIPKVMLMTEHNEKTNQICLYVLMREIYKNWQASDALASMRHNMEFIVIPVGNPWGLDNGSRTNFNKVDINRNFPIGWQLLGVIGDPTYSGTEPLSEVETQYIYQTMVNEKPDIFFDAHSYGTWNNNGQSIWIPTLNDKTLTAVTAATLRIYAQYKRKYPWLVDTVYDFANISSDVVVGGGLSSKAAQSVGAIGGTYETSWNLKNEPTGLTGHTTAVNLATDLLGTCILQCLSVIIDSQ